MSKSPYWIGYEHSIGPKSVKSIADSAQEVKSIANNNGITSVHGPYALLTEEELIVMKIALPEHLIIKPTWRTVAMNGNSSV